MTDYVNVSVNNHNAVIAQAGYVGPQGLQGVQGAQGLFGTQGVQGFGYAQLQGAQGSQGVQGVQGAKGAQGIQGVQGLQGNQGVQGVQGAKGAQGIQGVQGLQGVQGFQGVQGLQGNQGLQGAQGVQGLQGAQGLQGNNGIQGLQGYQGSNAIYNVDIATTNAIQGTYNSTNGTITGSSQQEIYADGVMLSLGKRVLVKNQSDPTQNGVYVVTTEGKLPYYTYPATLGTTTQWMTSIPWPGANNSWYLVINGNRYRPNGDIVNPSDVGSYFDIYYMDGNIYQRGDNWSQSVSYGWFTSSTVTSYSCPVGGTSDGNGNCVVPQTGYNPVLTRDSNFISGNVLSVAAGNSNSSTLWSSGGNIFNQLYMQGLQGNAGSNGAQGAQGLQGLQGNAGSNGAQGAQGLQGNAGSNGAQGLQGLQGIQGTTGPNGPATITQNSQSSAYTVQSSDNGSYIDTTSGGVTVSTTTGFTVGQNVVVYNDSASNITITQGSGVTLRLAGTSTTGSRTLAQYGIATVLCVGTNNYVVAGTGVS